MKELQQIKRIFGLGKRAWFVRIFCWGCFLFMAFFLGAVWWFGSGKGGLDTHGAEERATSNSAMPAIYDGFVSRWCCETHDFLLKEKAGIERELQRDSITPGKKELLETELAEMERRLQDGAAIEEMSKEDVPVDLVWESGGHEPEIGDERAKKGGMVTLWNPTPFPPTLRPFGPGSQNYFNYSQYDMVDMPLVAMHPQTRGMIRGMANRWAVSKDGRTVYFHLDPQASYSDGTPVRARDYLLNMCLRTSPHAQDVYYLDLWRRNISRVAIYGDDVLAITLPRVMPMMPLMAAKDMLPAHPGFYADFNRDYLSVYQWRVPPSTGGYRVEAETVERGHGIALKRVENWWAKNRQFYRYTCNVDTVKHVFMRDELRALEMFRRGDIDMMTVRRPNIWNAGLMMPPVLKGEIERIGLHTEYPHPPYGIYLNTVCPLLSSLDIRRGIQCAINMERVVNEVFQRDYKRLGSYAEGYGRLTDTSISAMTYDPDEARRCFAAAGFTHHGNDGVLYNDQGEKLSIKLTYANMSPLMEAVCAIITHDAAACGLELVPEPLESAMCSRKVFEKKHEAVLWAWPLPSMVPDVMKMCHSMFAYDREGHPIPYTDNIFSIADEELDAALLAQRQAHTWNELERAAHRVQRRIHDLCVWVPGWVEKQTCVAYWKRVKWPDSSWTSFCYPWVYDPIESHLYWLEE